MPDRLTLYWQPGCTSCLRTKEFLIERGIAFDSHDVLADPTQLASLAARGLRTVPVLLSGNRHCLAQDLDEVAAFVGVDLNRVRLPVNELLRRLDALLAVTIRLAAALNPAELETRIGNRNRTHIDLAYHVPMIVLGFLDAARGGELTYEHYERIPSAGHRTIASVIETISTVRRSLAAWRNEQDAPLASQPLRTYYGVRPLWAVLERTTWHVAQHCRQLTSLRAGVASSSNPADLDASLLAGLPLPQAVWDPEIQIA
jgi:glutaredoxin